MQRIDETTLTNAQRIRVLADYVERVQPNRFDMRAYSRGLVKHYEDLSGPHACGTAACAIGVACTIFQGLRLGKGGGPILRDQEMSYPGISEQFFGMRGDETFQAFSPSHEKRGNDGTPAAVAATLREIASAVEEREVGQ